jgi:hypothetical protein
MLIYRRPVYFTYCAASVALFFILCRILLKTVFFSKLKRFTQLSKKGLRENVIFATVVLYDFLNTLYNDDKGWYNPKQIFFTDEAWFYKTKYANLEYKKNNTLHPLGNNWFKKI